MEIVTCNAFVNVVSILFEVPQECRLLCISWTLEPSARTGTDNLVSSEYKDYKPCQVQSINQSITFATAPVTGDHWRRTSNLIKSMDKNQ